MDIQSFFDDVIHQHAGRLKGYFHEDAAIRWHCTNEQFTPEEYVRANCEYPNKWNGEIERIEEAGDTLILAARVFPADHSLSCHVVSFIHLKAGKIAALDEYWADDGDAPAWRQRMRIGRPIH